MQQQDSQLFAFLRFIPSTFPVAALVLSVFSQIMWSVYVFRVDSDISGGLLALVFISPVLVSAGWLTNFLPKVRESYNL